MAISSARNIGLRRKSKQERIALGRVHEMIEIDFTSKNSANRYEAVKAIRKLVAASVKIELSYVKQIVEAGAIPSLIDILNSDPDPKIQLEAAWALTNISSDTTEHAEMLISHRCVESFICGVLANDINVKEQCAWGLGNIVCGSYQARDYILRANGLPILLKESERQLKASFRRYVVWAISRLCQVEPPPPIEMISPAVPVLVRLLKFNKEESILEDACCALAFLWENYENIIPNDMKRDICGVLSIFTKQLTANRHMPALRIIERMVAGGPAQIDVAIECKVLPGLCFILENTSKERIKSKVCLIISYITAGTVSQIAAVLKTRLLASMNPHPRSELLVSDNAAAAIANVVIHGDPQQVEVVINKGWLRPLFQKLAQNERGILCMLEVMNQILRAEEELKVLEKEKLNTTSEIKEHLCVLINHINWNINQKAKDLWGKYFGTLQS